MDRILECKVCGKRFVAVRRDATTCSPRCRKRLSRTMAVSGDTPVTPEPAGAAVTLTAAPLPIPPPGGGVKVPTRVDVFGRPEEVVECAPEAAAHWDERCWHR